MPAYKLMVDFDVMEGLDAFTAKQRLEVFAILRHLFQNPNSNGDWQSRDAHAATAPRP